MKSFRWMVRLFALALLIPLVNPGGTMAQGSGRIQGTVAVLGPDNAPLYLPGADVVLHCDKAAGNERTVTTDETGRFSLSGLAPDRCSITASGAGFQNQTKTVDVTEASTLELSFQLGLQTVEEKITVTAAAPPIEILQTSPKEELSGATSQDAPLAEERVTDTIPLLPGVVRGSDGLLNIKGARASQSGLLVNSANVTDPVTGEYGFDLPIDVLQSVQVLTNPYDSEYGKFTGAITAVETKSGTEKFRFQFQNFIPRPRERDGAIVGLGGVSPRLSFSGPIQKGRAYFSQSLEYRFVRTRIQGLKHLDPVLHSDTKFESFDSHTQVDWNLGPLNRLGFSFSVFPQKRGFANLNTFNPQEATPNLKQRGFMVGISERKFFSNQSFLESLFSLKDFDADIFPAGSPFSPMILRPEENAGSFFNRQDRESRRYEWQELYHFQPLKGVGHHEAKIGFNLSHGTFAGIHASRPVLVERSDGTTAESIEFSGPTRLGRSSTEASFFLQDKWMPHPRVTLDFGLRYDRDTLGNDNNFAPRVGFSTALTADNRTVLRGGIGLFYDKIPLNAGTFEQLQRARVTRFADNGVTSLGPALLFQNVILGGDLDNPRSLAWNAELDRELARNFVLRFGYQQRRTRRDLMVSPLEFPQPVRLLGSTGRALYREFQVAARYQFGKQNQLFASYVRSHSYGDLNDFNQFFGNLENPILRPNERSLHPFDAPNRFLTWGDFKLPADIILSPVLEVRDGFPYSLLNAARDFAGPRNRAGRFPTFASLDIQVTKGIKLPFLGKNRKGRVGVRIFNLTNHFNPRDLQNILGSSPVSFREECSQFGAFCNSVTRNIRGKFVIEF